MTRNERMSMVFTNQNIRSIDKTQPPFSAPTTQKETQMQANHFTVSDEAIEAAANSYLFGKKAAELAFSEQGASAMFLDDGDAMAEAYLRLVKALGLARGMHVSADGRKGWTIRVERSLGRTILTFPGPLTPSCTGLTQLSEAAYQTMREEALDNMGASASALRRAPGANA